MYPDREKALAKGRRKGKTFIRVWPHIPAKG